jgi:predicted nucleic acid-binding Zn ribbon protein
MTEYKPDLPPDVKLPAGASINTAHQDYRKLEAVAHEEGWSQKSFSRVLGIEVARSTRAAPTPAPAAPAPAPAVDFDKLSTTQKFAHAVTAPSNRGGR